MGLNISLFLFYTHIIRMQHFTLENRRRHLKFLEFSARNNEEETMSGPDDRGTNLTYGAGGVLLEEDKVLIVIEDTTDMAIGKKAGMVSIPLGRIREQEEPSAAAEREFFEETGIPVTVVKHLQTFRIPGHAAEIYLMAPINQPSSSVSIGTLNPEWIKIEELFAMQDDLVRFPTKEAVQLALQQISTADACPPEGRPIP